MERVPPWAWYRVRHVGDGVTLIDEPFIKEFFRCNVWHVRGSDRDMLVDSGMGVLSLRRHIPLVSEKPLVAVASHTHFDHIGGHWEFPERLAHPAEADILTSPDRVNTLAQGCVEDTIFDQLPPEPYSSATYVPRAAPATRLIEDGDVIDLGNRTFQVIHTPGHSPGGIALFEAETGILISGDIVYDGPLLDDLPGSDPLAYARSLERLLALPVRVVHGGHFPSMGAERFKERAAEWLRERASGRQPPS